MRLKTLILAVAGLLAAQPANAASPEQDFVADMLGRFRAAFPAATFVPEPEDPLSLKASGGNAILNGGTINLQRIYGYCTHATKADCERTKAEFVDRITRTPPPAAAANLRIVVRDQQYYEYYLGKFKSRPERLPIIHKIGDDLFAILAVDSPETIELANSETVAKLGLTAEAAWALAEAQTAKAIPPVPTPDQLHEGSIALEGKEYMASMLIARAGWEKLSAVLGPDMFVTAASDALVFIGTIPDGPALDRFAGAVADDCRQAPRCVSPHIYRWKNGTWVIAR